MVAIGLFGLAFFGFLAGATANLVLRQAARELIDDTAEDGERIKKRRGKLDRAAYLSVLDAMWIAAVAIGIVILLQLWWHLFTGETVTAVLCGIILLGVGVAFLTDIFKDLSTRMNERRVAAIKRAVKDKPAKQTQFNEDRPRLEDGKEPEWSKAVDRIRSK